MKRSRNNVQKSVFDLSHENQITARPHGELYPVLCQPVLPGSHWNCNMETLARAVPLINPIYQRFDIYTHFFYVPNRLVWKNWEKFIAIDEMDENGQRPTPPVFPTIKVGQTSGAPDGIITVDPAPNFLNYTGCKPSLIAPGESVDISVLPWRCMVKIWNEYYRDIDLDQKLEESDGDSTELDLQQLSICEHDGVGFLRRHWEKDYFTSARPFAQKGAPVVVNSSFDYAGVDGYDGNAVRPASVVDGELTKNGTIDVAADGTLKTAAAAMFNENSVSLDTGNGFTIEDLRIANTMQKYFEKLMKRGSRYKDIMKSFFGVTIPDYQLDRPQYIGGGRQPLVISEVLQTSQSDTTPLGTYGGHAISSGNAGFNFTFPDYGYVIGLQSYMPRAKYMNGISRDLLKTDPYDFGIPDFANLGDQPVLNVELNGDLSSENRMKTFGYQERYAEYKFIPSTVSGMFRTDAILKTFHCGRDGDDYVLNPDFLDPLQDKAAIDRVFAMDDYDPFLVSIMFNIKAVLPLPRHSNPSLAL